DNPSVRYDSAHSSPSISEGAVASCTMLVSCSRLMLDSSCVARWSTRVDSSPGVDRVVTPANEKYGTMQNCGAGASSCMNSDWNLLPGAFQVARVLLEALPATFRTTGEEAQGAN